MELSLLGWRDGILLLVVLAAIYLMVMLLKLVQVGRRRTARELFPSRPLPTEPEIGAREEKEPEPIPPAARAAAISAYEEESHVSPGPFAVPPAPTFEWDDVKELFGEPPSSAPPPRGGFGESLADHLARSDVETEMQRMRDEMARMHREMEELRASRHVSPQYAEAMELSQRGLTAQDVADRLGISLAEAELVQALSRGKQNFD